VNNILYLIIYICEDKGSILQTHTQLYSLYFIFLFRVNVEIRKIHGRNQGNHDKYMFHLISRQNLFLVVVNDLYLCCKIYFIKINEKNHSFKEK
jgi:aromatic ring-cleaving dioxygenase